VIIAEGERWKWQRQLLAPLFRPDEVANHVPTFVDVSKCLLRFWDEFPPGSVQDIHGDMGAVTLQILEDTVLGVGLTQEDHRLVEAAVVDFLRPLTWKAAYAALRLPGSLPHPGKARRSRAIHDLSAVAARAIAHHRESGAETPDVLGRMMAARDPATGEAMPDTLIIDNLMIFLLAGHETTANALTWTLYLLALFPEWQELARREILRVAPDENIGGKEIDQLDGFSKNRCASFRRQRRSCAERGSRSSSGTSRLMRAPRSSSRSMCCTGTAGFGSIRCALILHASPRKRWLSAIAFPTSPLAPARAPVLVRPSPWSRERPCWRCCCRARASNFRRAKCRCRSCG
jgi:hypothetical protein